MHKSKRQRKSDTTIISKRIKTILVPIVFYTPEATFAFGAGTQLFFKTKNSEAKSRQSNIFGAVIYTLNNQLIIQAKPKN